MLSPSFCSYSDSSELSRLRSSFLMKKLCLDLILGITKSILSSSFSDYDDAGILFSFT